MTVKGIGPVKAERFGITLLEIVATVAEQDSRLEESGGGKAGSHDERAAEGHHDREREIGTKGPDSTAEGSVFNTQRSSPPLHPSPPALVSHPPHYWTWRLLSAGFTVEECAAIRGLSRETVLEHAQRAERDFEVNGP